MAQVTESEAVALDPLLEDPRRTGDEEENLARYQRTSHSGFKDATTGEALPPHLTPRAARREELAFMGDWKVWEEVPVQECWNTTGKPPLGGKWVDVNKGDDQNPLVRSRYVAMEIAKKTDKCEDFFAATPPLVALRLVLSRVASNRSHGRGGRKLLVIDARKAHFHALAERNLFVQLPPELAKPGICAKLRRCLYGTRDAPARGEAFAAGELTAMGFKRGRASPCCFSHRSRDLVCVVHGDDFIFAGKEEELDWVEKECTPYS